MTKYRWWILGGLALLLAAGAAFLLRRPPTLLTGAGATSDSGTGISPAYSASSPGGASPAAKNAALLNALKEELFALESEKISGTLAPAEYDEQKAALETVLKRALKKKS